MSDDSYPTDMSDPDDLSRTRTRTRTRTRSRQDAAAAAPSQTAETPEAPEASPRTAERSSRTRRRRRSSARSAAEDAATSPSAEDAATSPSAEDAATSPSAEAEEKPAAQAGADKAKSERPRSRSRRRRGNRGGRGRRGGNKTRTSQQQKTSASATPSTSTAESTRAPSRKDGRNRRSRSSSDRRQRPTGGVSEETRRAVVDGPPRRMLVHVGEERTQVAVLEERDLVEHYVTHRKDVSYVGNIYMGRVQNVLPGMEAAFVDIGKGRNGVLYAGEVNYDEADLDGELPRIEQTLKPGQPVLVQVTKDPMGTKGARLTQLLSIAGRYCVLAPGEGMLGISRKLTDDERKRLRSVLTDVKPDGYGLIVRTAAEGATKQQLDDDVNRLVRIWEQVDKRAKEAKPLEPVYEEPDLVIRVIRDAFGPEYTDLIVDSDELGEMVRSYLADVSPDLVDRVSVYHGGASLFDDYEVTNQIRRALEKKVWLASGGYLIVEKTEAMWVIDVNTGKFVGKDNLEATVLKNNLEAAEEIARQLRLRDMGGIIVIDFVDMLVPANRDEVLKRFKRELVRDKTKSRVMEISKLGLVQMTRKNVSQGLTESFTTVCECCEGRGAQMVDTIV